MPCSHVDFECAGCKVSHPSQIQHMDFGCGCLSLWSSQVEMHFDDAQHHIDIESAISKLNNEAGWKLQVCNDSVDLYELVKKTNCELGDTFGSIITVYMKYFDSLDLYHTKQ